MDGYVYFEPAKLAQVARGAQTEARLPARRGDTLVGDVLQIRWGAAPSFWLRIGGVYAALPWRLAQQAGGEIQHLVRVTSIRQERLADVDNAGARRNGYADRGAFMRAWSRDYWTGDDVQVWVIGLEVFQPTPVEA